MQELRIVTFNYDELIEIALDAFFYHWRWPINRTSSDLPQYVENRDFHLYKLHGSTGWSRVIDAKPNLSDLMTTAAIEYASGTMPTGGAIRMTPPQNQVGEDGCLTLPAIAVPMASKTNFECPDRHLRALRQDLPEVTHVLVIGWRAADAHAVRFLLGTDEAPGLQRGWSYGIVSGSDHGIEETRSNLHAVLQRGHPKLLLLDGFTGLIAGLDSHMSDLLLSPFGKAPLQ